MGVFDGYVAWFSDTVKDKHKLLWKAHGGTIKDAAKATHLFTKAMDASDVREVDHRLRDKEHIFLYPRFIKRCILLGVCSSPIKAHVLQKKRNVLYGRSEQPNVRQENPEPTAGPSKPPEAICITDMRRVNFRVHLKPNASLGILEKLREELYGKDSEHE
ncbi:hypothetical protein MRX96_036101 [Rhipicephalus microplus]